jgi:ribonuclease D
VLGGGLDKAEQCSRWDRRPLTAAQVSQMTHHTIL